MARRYLDDLRVGEAWDYGPRTVTREEIVAFAREFDPQPFHLDEEAGRRAHFGGLIASGWHTTALCQRMVVDGLTSGAESLGSPGVDELRWRRPVRPGDELRLRVECVEVKPSRSRPDRGRARFHYELRNQNAEVVMTMTGMARVCPAARGRVLVRRRTKVLLGMALAAAVAVGACFVLLPDRFRVNAPIVHLLFGQGIRPPAAVVLARLQAPPGFAVRRFAEDLPNARFLRFTPTGSLLVTLPRSGQVMLLEPDREPRRPLGRAKRADRRT